MKVAVVAGTRPEIIRVALLIKELEKQGISYSFIHTGQHYDFEMSARFIEELDLPEPDFKLNYHAKTHATQLATMLPFLEKTFVKGKFDIVFGQGDTNSTLATALAAIKINLPVAHIEAGNRCFDLTRVEEVNRRLVDHMSSLLFAQSKFTRDLLISENIPERLVHVTGNTVVDACLEYRRTAEDNAEEWKKNKKRNCILITMHRAETVDDREKISGFLNVLEELGRENDLVFPLHPRTRDRLKKFGLYKALKDVENITLLPPLGYFDFLVFLNNAKLLLTDSGGALKEATALRIPTIIYNDKWPDTEGKDVFWKLSGYDYKKVIELVNKMNNKSLRNKIRRLPCPFGDGKATQRILKITLREHESGRLKTSEYFRNL